MGSCQGACQRSNSASEPNPDAEKIPEAKKIEAEQQGSSKVVDDPIPEDGIMLEIEPMRKKAAVVQDKHDPDVAHHFVAALASNLDWKGTTEVPTWLNELVSRLWPKLSLVLEKKFFSIAESTINGELPEWLANKCKVQKVDFGDTEPPFCTGISCDESSDGIKVALAFDFPTGVKADMTVAGLPVGVTGCMATGSFVVELGPLLGHVPLVGGISVYFIDPPKLQYTFTGAGTITDLPLLRNAVRAAIDAFVASRYVLPNAMMVPLVHEDNVWHNGAKSVKGVLRVTAISAKDLGDSDWSIMPSKGRSDPYVRVQVGGNHWTSSTVKGNTSPTWTAEDWHDFTVYDLSQKVNVEVLDADWLTGDDSLGVILPMAMQDALNESEKPVSLYKHQHINRLGKKSSLQGKKKGHLKMKYEWLEISQEPLGNAASSAEGFVLMAEIGALRLPAKAYDALQVQLHFGDRTTRSRYLEMKTAKVDAAAASVTATTVDIVRRGAGLGVNLQTLAEMTDLDLKTVEDITKDSCESSAEIAQAVAERRLEAELKFGATLAVPIPSLEALDKAKVELRVRDLKTIHAKTSLSLGSAKGLSWPPPGHEGKLAQLLGEGSARMELEVKLSVAALRRKKGPNSNAP